MRRTAGLHARRRLPNGRPAVTDNPMRVRCSDCGQSSDDLAREGEYCGWKIAAGPDVCTGRMELYEVETEPEAE
jgi:hypothetical protein